MRIEKLSAELTAQYDDFLLRTEDSLFYYCSKYKDFLKKLLHCEENYLLAMEGNEIYGVLPLMFISITSGRVYNSLPYFGSNGGIISDNEKAYAMLLNEYNEIAHDKTTLSTTVITNPLFIRNSADKDIAHNYMDYRIGQWTRLLGYEEKIEDFLNKIDSSARRNVRKAQREGITVEIDHGKMDRLREMHQENIQAIGGNAKHADFFRLVPECFSAGKDFDLYVAKRDASIIAGLLIFYFNQTVEYFIPATYENFRSLQPLSLILQTAITDSAKRGFKWWNWGGTWKNQIGVYRFKKKWAAMDRNYFYYTQLNEPGFLSWPRDRILNTFRNFFLFPFSEMLSEKRSL